jgi:hypothetical protein
MFESTTANGELAKEAQAADLIAGGKYPFTVVDIRESEQKEAYDNGDKNPLYGHPVVSLQVKLEGVGAKGYDPLDGKSRTHFIKVTPDKVYNEKGALLSASKLAGAMIDVSGTAGKSFADTLRWFTSNKAQVSIGQFETRDGKTINTTAGISRLA